MTKNDQALAAHGVLYPIAGRGKDDYRFGHHLLPWALANRPLRELEYSWPDMTALHDEIAASNTHTVIISSENFSTILDQRAIDLLAHKLSGFDVRIICYLRRQDDFIVSLWSTAVAHYGEKQPLENYLVYPPLDYARIVRIWATSFGRDAITLRIPHGAQLAENDTVADALSLCGIDPSLAAVQLSAARENKRFPAHITRILFYLNEHDADLTAIARVREMGSLFERRADEPDLLTLQQRQALLAQHDEGNRELARTYFGRSDGRLFNDLTVVEKKPEPVAHLDTYPTDIAQPLGLLIDDFYAAISSHYDNIVAGRIDIGGTRDVQSPTDAAPSNTSMAELPEDFRIMSDGSWLETLLQTTTSPDVKGFRFPSFPQPEVQAAFVGTACEAALQEAFNFYILVKGYAKALGMPLERNMKFLDFGVGWGRFPRIFWKEILASNLHGCDVDPHALAICRSTGVPGSFDRLYPRGRLPYPDGYFSGGIAYSVFTHLSEESHLHWMQELARVLRPGAVFCMTLEPRRFADFIEQLPAEPTSSWHAGLRKFADHADEFRKQFDQGRFVYLPTGGGAHRQATEYGDAMVPPSFIAREWTQSFALRAYIDNAAQYWQAVAVMQRI